ncbi:uncharacterized protein ATC70_001302 [Mucor velutinosus]|uniref:CNNM transmembrane domain-containing protein n=1 Tax=Mucor velutinosus TaxID=708070 RepID=A0AAN7DIZ9_9FUNG|nr:hypothetical protein ATC70_001302 [Mucor velutinosus]
MLLKPSIYYGLISLFAQLALAEEHEEEEHGMDPKSVEFWGQIIAIFFLVALSGIVAGLTLGLMSLDTTNLSILEIAGTPQQQYYASRIIPIRKNGHILLATLLLTNTVLNETLPILFDDIFSKGFISVIVSTALLVLFAEIIPQAIFSKHGLAIGAMFAFPVRVLIALWFVISWPISKFLDHLLGTHTGFTYGIAEFGALVKLHDKSIYDNGTLKHETVNMLQNVLDMQEKHISQIVTPTSNTLMLHSSTSLNSSTVLQYLSSGYSHILVYSNDEKEQLDTIQDDYEILGVLDLRSLLDLEQTVFDVPIGSMKFQPYLTASSRTPIIEAMNKLLQAENETVVLVYHTEQDIEIAKQEQDENLRALASIQAGAIKKHAKSIRCAIRRLFGSTCPVCQNLSNASIPAMAIAVSGSQKLEEGTMLENTNNSTTPTMIDTALESGLLGIVTTVDILNQLSFTRQHLNIQHQDSGHLNARQNAAKIV